MMIRRQQQQQPLHQDRAGGGLYGLDRPLLDALGGGSHMDEPGPSGARGAVCAGDAGWFRPPARRPSGGTGGPEQYGSSPTASSTMASSAEGAPPNKQGRMHGPGWDYYYLK